MTRWLCTCLFVVACADKTPPNEKAIPLSELELRPGDAEFWIDTLNQKPFAGGAPIVVDAKKDPICVVGGWAFDSEAKKSASNVILILDRHSELYVKYGLPREDLVAKYKSTAVERSGFETQFDCHRLSPGEHTLALKVISADGRGYYLPSRVLTFEVK